MFEEFVGRNIPPYAILSHTWGAGEVTFPLYAKPESRLLKGYEKIEQSCRLAAEGEIGYVWVDTCCIDKSSSAELSEAINSMYRWYASAEVCFVYLSDFEIYTDDAKVPTVMITHSECPRGSTDTVDFGQSEDDPAFQRFKKCKWFRRGWTLQEMLAPDSLEFFDANWSYVGEKLDEMIEVLARITKIEPDFFDFHQEASVAQKLSWAANRKTTRIEDTAYCLLGLFDINMPLLYGEGEKAFKRLQLEILRSNDDESIFAWTDRSLLSSGMLATSPSNFADSGQIVPLEDLTLYRSPYQMTHQGLQIELEPFARQEHTGSPFEAYLRRFNSDDHNERPEKLVALLIDPLEILPRVTRARRVMTRKIQFRKFPDTQNSQEANSHHRPDSAQESSFLIKESRKKKPTQPLVKKSYPVSAKDPNPKEQGKFSLRLFHGRHMMASDSVRCPDGRDYVGVGCRIFGGVKMGISQTYELRAAIIQLPRPACKLAHLELFLFPFITYSDEMLHGLNQGQLDYSKGLSQIQTGQLKPCLLSEGDQLVHELSSFVDIVIALRPSSTTDTDCLKLEMELDLVQ